MLEMKNVTKIFGGFKALDDLNLHVPQGAVYGLVGPNGAGKSTAIRHLTGVYRPDSGEVNLQGKPVYENPQAKAKIGYIPDDVFYYPSATMEDMRKFYQGLYPTFDQVLYKRLDEVFHLPQRSPIRRFSKGMQKQAAFHLTVCLRPEVLILDEPVDGLDPVMRRQVMSMILSDVADCGSTVLISSHNLRELEDVCDHVGILSHGKVLVERSLSDLQENLVKMQVVFQEKELPQLPADMEVLHVSHVGRIHTLIIRGTPTDVTNRLAVYAPILLEALPLSLEEIFIYELGGDDYAVKDIVL